MRSKKNPKADLNKKSTFYFSIGLFIVLFVSWQAIEYKNCGDWVESCTALVEHFDGTFELIYWLDKRKEILTDTYVEEQFEEIRQDKIRVMS